MTNMQGIRSEWQEIRQLGSGGQSEVFLVRRPERVKAREQNILQIHGYNPWGTSPQATRFQYTGEFADAVSNYARAELPSELGAMKRFKLRGSGTNAVAQAANRLRRETEVLDQGRSGLPKLLDCNLAERWMVTEYFSEGSLESKPERYKGNATLALKAFLSIVKTVAELHAEGIVHRDIKPANVFVRDDHQLVLGDFGIVFLPNQPNRLTLTNESVGPHDYMPPWAEVGGRLGEVGPKIDVYMLGKLLWCMVSGKLRLNREYFSVPGNDVTELFGDDPAMHMVNRILEKCVVEHETDCQTSSGDLVGIVDAFVRALARGGQLLHPDVPRPCRVCGHGFYRNDGFPIAQPPIPRGETVGLRITAGKNDMTALPVFPYVCDQCGHVEFFTKESK